MPDPDIAATVAKLIQRLLDISSEDQELRSYVRALALQVLAATGPVEAAAEGPSPVAGEGVVAGAISGGPAPRPPAPVALPSAIREGLRDAVLSMTSGAPAAPMASTAGPLRPEVTDSDLPLVEARCRAKAEGARWAAKRRLRLAEGADYEIEI